MQVKVKSKIIIRYIFLILIFAWMIRVFMFSNEPADTSEKTSLNITEKIVNIFEKQNIEVKEKEKIIDQIDPIIRKLAHFTLYAIGGFLILNYINTYEILDTKKFGLSITAGAIYACSDEIHQIFVDGRSGQITDVIIDSFGIILGILIAFCVIKIYNKINKKNM